MSDKCKSCDRGDCYDHVVEFLDREGKVKKCTCPDPANRHGKMHPRRDARVK